MSGIVRSKLPNDWDAEIKLKVKIPLVNQWLEIPCMSSWYMLSLTGLPISLRFFIKYIV
jgi:hypothetical protein